MTSFVSLRSGTTGVSTISDGTDTLAINSDGSINVDAETLQQLVKTNIEIRNALLLLINMMDVKRQDIDLDDLQGDD
jgi:hypothetical protein